ncbi:hypothetical protein [Elioraea sp.]|uniref:hypothetical protein n=1 Tax=Elioraea sp. TaxID=2185103 RepID=UPI00307D2337
MARITAESLQIGAEARGSGAGTLGLAGQRGDVARVLRRGLSERGGIRLRRTAGHRRVEAGGVALGAEMPGGSDSDSEGHRETDRQRVPAEQRRDRRARHG